MRVAGFACFVFTLPFSHPVLTRLIFRPMQQQPGLSAATGPFAKVRLQADVEGKVFFVGVFFCRDILLTPCPCPCPSLLDNTAAAEDVGRWFAGRDNIMATKVSFVWLLCCSPTLAHALPVSAPSHSYAYAGAACRVKKTVKLCSLCLLIGQNIDLG